MRKNSLQLQQLQSRMHAFQLAEKIAAPPGGWVKAVRLALGMSLDQLGRKLSITRQSAQAIEEREKEGTLTIKALKDAASALDMRLVYGLVPNDHSLEELIDRKARELAKQIVLRTSNSMKLEDQENTRERIEKAITERADEIKSEMPKALWD